MDWLNVQKMGVQYVNDGLICCNMVLVINIQIHILMNIYPTNLLIFDVIKLISSQCINSFNKHLAQT